MNQEKVGKFIKDLRKKYNLTQKDLADKYNVTYQAVSKWENGKNMPDIGLLKQMSKDFNISLEEILDGESKKKGNNKKYIIGGILLVLIILVIILFVKKDDDFKFKTLSSACENFNISGSISYNDKKSAIYITNIKYCGGNDDKLYKKIDCTLYESHVDIEKKISSYEYDKDKSIKLDEFLNSVTFSVDNYKKNCDDLIYLLINAMDEDNNISTYKIPLKMVDSCIE